MDSDSRNFGSFSYGAPPPGRMERLEQGVIPQHSTLAQQQQQPANPLDLTSAIVRELQRGNHNQQQLGWQSWTVPQLGGGGGSGGSEPGYGSYLVPYSNGHGGRFLPLQHIRPFDETIATTALEPTEFSTESLASAPQPAGFYLSHQSFEDCSRSASSPWIERMMQADIGISTSLSLAQTRGVTGDASQTVDFSSDLQPQQHQHQQQQQKSTRGTHEPTVEISADLYTDEEDQDNSRPIDEKRKKRMLSNRASAQRSRQRRQERLDQLEVLTAKLRVENSTLQTKLSAAIQVAKKYEDQSKTLQKKVDKLTKEVEAGSCKSTKPAVAFDECVNSQQTTSASSCEMIGLRTSADRNEASTTQSSPTEEVSPVRRSFSVCRVGKKRFFGELSEAGRSQLLANTSFLPEPRGSSFDSPVTPSAMDSLDTDRWLEFAEFGLSFK